MRYPLGTAALRDLARRASSDEVRAVIEGHHQRLLGLSLRVGGAEDEEDRTIAQNVAAVLCERISELTDAIEEQEDN